MKPIEFTATVSKDAPPELKEALGRMAVHVANHLLQIPTEPTMNEPTPTPQTGESPSDSLLSFTMNQLTNRIAALETDLATALRERDEATTRAIDNFHNWQADKMVYLSENRKLTAERDAALAQLAEMKEAMRQTKPMLELGIKAFNDAAKEQP